MPRLFQPTTQRELHFWYASLTQSRSSMSVLQINRSMTTNARPSCSLCWTATTAPYFCTAKRKAVSLDQAGKTYTMLGSRDTLGILHYALMHVFGQKEQDGRKKPKVYVSYLEIYNEGLIDLLNPKGDPASLKVKEDNRVD